MEVIGSINTQWDGKLAIHWWGKWANRRLTKYLKKINQDA